VGLCQIAQETTEFRAFLIALSRRFVPAGCTKSKRLVGLIREVLLEGAEMDEKPL
jgi:hypothetical protein